MSSDDGYDREPKIPKLTKENHGKWFRNSKLKMKGQGIFYTIEVTKHAYAWIVRPGAGTSTSNATTTQVLTGAADTAEQVSVEELTSSFKGLGGTWNMEKANEYDKDEAKALFYITNSLHDHDDALVYEHETASALWTALKVEYSKTDQLAANNMMKKIQNFSWKDDKDVDYAWRKLKEYRRKIIAAKSSARGLYSDEALLQIMLRALPRSYASMIDYFDVQTTLTVEEKIVALRMKELRLQGEIKHTNAALSNHRYSNYRRNLDHSMHDRSHPASITSTRTTGCLLCKGDHWARDCKYKDEVQELGRKMRERDERAQRRAARSERSLEDKGMKPPRKPAKSDVKITSKRKHGYAVKVQDYDLGTIGSYSDSHNEIGDDFTSSNTDIRQECYISAEQASKFTPAKWAADTGASSHMNDKRNLFRRPLKHTPLTTDQAGKGVLLVGP